MVSKFIVCLLGDVFDMLCVLFRVLMGVVLIFVGMVVFVLGGYLLLLFVLLFVGLNDLFDYGFFVVFLIEISVLIIVFLGVVLLILLYGLIWWIFVVYWLMLIVLGGGVLVVLLNNGDFYVVVILVVLCLMIVLFGCSFYW